ncbi:hypothetical protein MBEHAL_2474 [Halarchaeum acidiphilum MH1-52-1]|uniref:Uncharacterized protein n=1 Tax=Halarchaeum acidiphilum MH1-52-1 TaxID=1261545 RepID=U3A7Q2_9EURY|nr:hypothetical protein [Halarchaeum acidiphilum]GAD53714.1 hypothetical protein MBEHAL_2474 [Halarchaeum acidiphilum MH1-52-1]
MPSASRVVGAAVAVLVGIVALLYSFLVAQQLLLGVGVAFALFVVAAFVYHANASRRSIVVLTMLLTLVYGAATLQLLVAVIAACVVYLSAWLTGPDSPVDAPDTTILPAGTALERAGGADDADDTDGVGTSDTEEADATDDRSTDDEMTDDEMTDDET